MIPANLTHYIETEIIPRYEKFDKAHNLSHVQAVIEESLSLAKQYDVNESMAYTIAAYHDTGLCHDRATHHLISGEILKQDVTLRQWFNEIEIETMKEAVADRVIDPTITLRRTVQYGLKQQPEADKEWHYQRFHQHLMDKYAPGGYLKLWLPDSKNTERLKELQTIILNEELLKKTFNKLFSEEKNN